MFLAWVPIGIAVVALIASLYSTYLARRDLVASHRPYVWVVTHGYLQDQKLFQDPRTLAKRCTNAPAILIKEQYTIAVTETDDSGGQTDKVVFDVVEDSGESLIHPDERSQTTYVLDFDLDTVMDNRKAERLTRKARIDYKEVSTSRQYYFEAEWELDRQARVWRPTRAVGD